MKVLMLGWEFPPFKSGGLGTACFNLTKHLSKKGISITFVMPHAPENATAEFVDLKGINKYNLKIRKIISDLTPYAGADDYAFNIGSLKGTYGSNLFEEVERFTKAAEIIAKEEDFDVIHAHDWMTYNAGLRAKEIAGKPLVVHMHATEFDRTGNNNPNMHISHIEYRGMQKADRVITNSNYEKNLIVEKYNIDPNKIEVAHWGVDPGFKPHMRQDIFSHAKKEKLVLFLGRVTLQKGPDYFIEVAKKVIDIYPNVRFIIAGEGDMLQRVINRSIELGISDKVSFTGFLHGEDVDRAFQMADLFVMPSVSEPFGLVALEALKNGTPAIISKQSGVSEVLKHALKVDFWDTNEMTNKIVNILRYNELHNELRDNSYEEARKLGWENPAQKCIEVYREVLR